MIKLKLSIKTILDKEFHVAKHGYDSEEVDAFLDIVIKDYQEIEEYVKQNLIDLAALKSALNLTSLKLKTCESQIANSKVQSLKSADCSNLDLLKRISNLEQQLYEKEEELKKIQPKQSLSKN